MKKFATISLVSRMKHASAEVTCVRFVQRNFNNFRVGYCNVAHLIDLYCRFVFVSFHSVNTTINN